MFAGAGRTNRSMQPDSSWRTESFGSNLIAELPDGQGTAAEVIVRRCAHGFAGARGSSSPRVFARKGLRD